MAKWIDQLFSLNKEASTDAQQEFTKKVKASGWVDGVMGIDEPALVKEADQKIEAELAVRAEITKEAAYEPFQTTEETLKHDYRRDVSILSDFTLASMIAEMRGHAKQDFPENATEYFEAAKKDVKSDRKAVEKELLEGTGMSAQLDTFKAFADYKKDETPKQATEKELYKPQLKDVNDDLSKGGKVDAYAETDEQHAKTMLGVGREESERTDVTAQPGEVHKNAALVRDPDTELHIGTIVRLARTIMTKEGFLLPEGSSWEVTELDGYHYTISANGKSHTISGHDSPKFNKLASQKEAGSPPCAKCGNSKYKHPTDDGHCSQYVPPTSEEPKKASQEIENRATKEQIFIKIAEIKSPWAVVEKDGQEVIARISDEQVSKESVEEKENLNK